MKIKFEKGHYKIKEDDEFSYEGFIINIDELKEKYLKWVNGKFETEVLRMFTNYACGEIVENK